MCVLEFGKGAEAPQCGIILGRQSGVEDLSFSSLLCILSHKLGRRRKYQSKFRSIGLKYVPGKLQGRKKDENVNSVPRIGMETE